MNAETPPFKDPKARIVGKPFRVTPDNIVAWKGKSGVRARGCLVSGDGDVNLNAPPAFSNFDAFAIAIARHIAGTEEIREIELLRQIRNRPRLKAMLGAA
jgi:hypothetical protein